MGQTYLDDFGNILLGPLEVKMNRWPQIQHSEGVLISNIVLYIHDYMYAFERSIVLDDNILIL